jgi:glutamate dehydrogenase (NAD(P)+)
VIVGDPKMAAVEKERLIRAFARAIHAIDDYIVGPDMGTDETCMAWCKDEIGRAVGLPPEIGGIPLDEIGATGYGLGVCAEVAQEFCDVRLEGARVAIEGFGSVGRHAARFLADKGARVVAVADSSGALVDRDGLDVAALATHKLAGRRLLDFPGGRTLALASLLDVGCDIFVPAARPDVIREDNAARLSAKLVLPGANIAVTPGAEQVLHERGILVIPDFIANAGGVICASIEYHGGSRREAFAAIEERIAANTRAVLAEAKAGGEPPRRAAERVAVRRVRRAMSLRR